MGMELGRRRSPLEIGRLVLIFIQAGRSLSPLEVSPCLSQSAPGPYIASSNVLPSQECILGAL